jgi:CheY-like chemotaxis protein
MMLPQRQAKILYVDDEIDNLTIFKAAFRRLYDIQTALSGKEALQMMRNQPPEQPFDVLITDQRMPEMTGVELLEIAAAEFPQTVRMMLTGYSDMEAIIRAINKGNIFRYLTKPWELDELRQAIDEAFIMARQRNHLPTETADTDASQTAEWGILMQLQQIIQPTEEAVKAVCKDAFIFRPQAGKPEKSMMAFYHLAEKKQSLVITAACLTEDLPKGAIFSLIIKYLTDSAVLNGITLPAYLLAELQLNFCTASRIMPHVTDLSIGITLINHQANRLIFAGTCQNLIVITAGETQVLQGMPQPLGKSNNAFNADDFQQHEQPFTPNRTAFYMATTGMAEHLCGFKNRNFAGQYLVEILEELHNLPAVRQKQLIRSLWDEWQAQPTAAANTPATDPLIIGISI